MAANRQQIEQQQQQQQEQQRQNQEQQRQVQQQLQQQQAARAAAKPDVVQQLKGIQELLDGGVLTPEEFEMLKRRVLDASTG